MPVSAIVNLATVQVAAGFSCTTCFLQSTCDVTVFVVLLIVSLAFAVTFVNEPFIKFHNQDASEL